MPNGTFDSNVRGTPAVMGTGSNGAEGIFGDSDELGVLGTGGAIGVSGEGSTGVRGNSSSGTGTGVEGYSGSGSGIKGTSSSGSGVEGYSGSGSGVEGHSSSGAGVKGKSDSGTGVHGIGSPAGEFLGNVYVKGSLSKSAGGFRIDHPLDPENKYLSHSFVESPDMLNVYNGNVTTDAKGEASVTLPDYYEALNQDFRYQLTVIGQFAQAIVAEEVRNN